MELENGKLTPIPMMQEAGPPDIEDVWDNDVDDDSWNNSISYMLLDTKKYAKS